MDDRSLTLNSYRHLIALVPFHLKLCASASRFYWLAPCSSPSWPAGSPLLQLPPATGQIGPCMEGPRDEQRFSPLSQINEQNIGRLGLAWSKELGTTRGLEATPIVSNGVIYTTVEWSVALALDARSGAILWTFDPKVNRAPRPYHLLRRGQSGSRPLPRQGVPGHARWPAHRARRQVGTSGLGGSSPQISPLPMRLPELPASPREWF